MRAGVLLFAAAATLGSALAADPSSAKETVKLAFVGPLTGGNAAAGVGGRNSAELAVRQHNARASSKYEFELVPLDDECKPSVGMQVATRIGADRSITAAVAHYCSAVAIETVDVYARFHLPIVIWGAILPAITYGNNHPEIHRVSGTMLDEARLAAKFLPDHGYGRIAVIHDTTDFGKGQNKFFSEALAGGRGKIVGTFPVGPDQQDLTAELTEMKALAPDLVFVEGLTPLGVRVRTQMARVGLNAQLAGVSGIMTAGFLEGAGPAAEGTISFHNGSPIEKYPGGPDFLRAYGAAGFRESPDAYGPFAYAAAQLVMDAVDKVGPDRRKVTDELSRTKGFSSLIGEITFDDHRQNRVEANAYVVQGGRWVEWADSGRAAAGRKPAGP